MEKDAMCWRGLDDSTIVAVSSGKLLANAFHPEITDDNRFHPYFPDMVKEIQSDKEIHTPIRK